ncbi:FecR family protein [Methylomonas sp. CM2]|uniref:FecR family protein n=1 Tax=Methylomonas sp. CM2 TaxID=3417647 RepID=UPI003CE9F1B6
MSSSDTHRPNRETIEREAVVWLARQLSGEMTDRELAEYRIWLARDPQHAAADRKMQRLARLLPQAIGAVDAQPSATAIAPCPRTPDAKMPPRRRMFRRAGSLGGGLAVAASLVWAVCGGYCVNWLSHPWADYRTLVGEQRTVQLSDGSTVHLNTDTALDVNMSAGERRVQLLRGEAEFEVAHDSQRPFRVTSGQATTEALGTRFVVRYANAAGDVTLLEGKVRTTRTNHQGQLLGNVILEPGEHIAFNDDQLGAVQATDLSIADAWRRGRIVMNFVPLQDVVDEINRYRPGHVFLLNSELAQRKIHVAMDVKRIDDWLNALGNTLPVQVLHAGHIVVLQGRQITTDDHETAASPR